MRVYTAPCKKSKQHTIYQYAFGQVIFLYNNRFIKVNFDT